MLKDDFEELADIIARLEAWQNNSRVKQHPLEGINKVKSQLLRILNQAEDYVQSRN